MWPARDECVAQPNAVAWWRIASAGSDVLTMPYQDFKSRQNRVSGDIAEQQAVDELYQVIVAMVERSRQCGCRL
ncbi:hypothetical protein IBT46_17175 [Erwinia sp. S38]|nr:hypothetical protein [Erwinia sp. S38]